MEDEWWLTVWLPISNPLLRDDAFDPYEPFAESVSRALEEKGLGCFDGAMTSATHANLYFPLNPAGDVEEAARVVMAALRSSAHAPGAIVARCGFTTRDGQRTRVEELVWPPDYSGELPR